jgi:myosin heavy subunit
MAKLFSGNKKDAPQDLTLLETVTEEGVTTALQKRFKIDEICTSTLPGVLASTVTVGH